MHQTVFAIILASSLTPALQTQDLQGKLSCDAYRIPEPQSLPNEKHFRTNTRFLSAPRDR
jgi:hypothetical protein